MPPKPEGKSGNDPCRSPEEPGYRQCHQQSEGHRPRPRTNVHPYAENRRPTINCYYCRSILPNEEINSSNVGIDRQRFGKRGDSKSTEGRAEIVSRSSEVSECEFLGRTIFPPIQKSPPSRAFGSSDSSCAIPPIGVLCYPFDSSSGLSLRWECPTR